MTGIKPAAGRPRKRPKDSRRFWLVVMLMPAVILQVLFRYVPLFGISIAFLDYNPFIGVFQSQFVGLKYFRQFLGDPRFWTVLLNTLRISALDILFGFFSPIIFALLLNEIMNLRFKKVAQTVSYLPHFLSWVIITGIFNRMFAFSQNGAVNGLLMGVFGLEKPVAFMTNAGIFTGIMVFAGVWQSVGWNAIIYIASLSGIDSTLYEAAALDGANRLRQTWHVTLPGLAPIIIVMFVLKIPQIFSVGFDRVFNMQNPAVVSATDVISTYVYRMGIQDNQYSFATAVGLMQMLISFTLVMVFNNLSKRIANVGAF